MRAHQQQSARCCDVSTPLANPLSWFFSFLPYAVHPSPLQPSLAFQLPSLGHESPLQPSLAFQLISYFPSTCTPSTRSWDLPVSFPTPACARPAAAPSSVWSTPACLTGLAWGCWRAERRRRLPVTASLRGWGLPVRLHGFDDRGFC